MKYYLPQILRCLSCRFGSSGFTVFENVDNYYLVCEKQVKLPEKKCRFFVPMDGGL
ncbi:MAG: hypothetical protein IJE95_05100 [Methanocorpusculum sp.]|nr:hypothetical protein [Methanocorpusculum sp.]